MDRVLDLMLWITLYQPATATSAASASQPSNTDTKAALIIALVTAAVTVAGIVLKDLLFKILEERRADKRVEQAVYERYSKPLAASAISLLHRLHEMLLREYRPVFLKPTCILTGAGQGSTFWAYKKLSTMYRLANLLGWIRACRREFSHLRLAEKRENEPIGRTIDLFEKALADGSWVEGERVKRLCSIWHICGSEYLEEHPKTLAALGVRVDNSIYEASEKAPSQDLGALEDCDREALCTKISKLLTTELNTNPVNQTAMAKT